MTYQDRTCIPDSRPLLAPNSPWPLGDLSQRSGRARRWSARSGRCPPPWPCRRTGGSAPTPPSSRCCWLAWWIGPAACCPTDLEGYRNTMQDVSSSTELWRLTLHVCQREYWLIKTSKIQNSCMAVTWRPPPPPPIWNMHRNHLALAKDQMAPSGPSGFRDSPTQRHWKAAKESCLRAFDSKLLKYVLQRTVKSSTEIQIYTWQ